MWFARKMVSAEVLKLRRNRGQYLTALILTVGVAVVYFAVVEGFHLYNSASHGPAGGASNFANAINVLTFIGSTAAIIIGARAGSIDQSTGVFRDQVATGRSRAALFGARVAGSILFFLPFILVALGVTVVATLALHGNLANPTASTILSNSAVTIAVTLFNLLLALGFASLTLSRSITVGVLLVWTLFAQRLIVNITVLGSLRKGIPLVAQHALHAVRGGPFATSITESFTAGVIVLLAWSVAALAVGAWRTMTMDA